MSPRACVCGSTSCSHRRSSRRRPGTYAGQYQTNREALLKIWNADPLTRCCFCGGLQIVGDPWSPDHIEQVTDGGGDHLSNLRPAHLSCNKRDGALTKQRKAKEAADRRAEARYRATLELIQGGR